MPVRYLSDPEVAWLSYWPDHHPSRRALNAMRGKGLKSPTRLRRTSRRHSMPTSTSTAPTPSTSTPNCVAKGPATPRDGLTSQGQADSTQRRNTTPLRHGT